MFDLAKQVNIFKDAVLNKGIPVDSSVLAEVKRIFKTMTDILGILEDRWSGEKGAASDKSYGYDPGNPSGMPQPETVCLSGYDSR